MDQEFLLCAFECLGQAWPKNASESQGEFSFPTSFKFSYKYQKLS